MKTVTAMPKSLLGEVSETAPSLKLQFLVKSSIRYISQLIASLSAGMRLVRAYNELHRMNNSTLHDLGYRRGELDRVLAGHRPRNTRSRH